MAETKQKKRQRRQRKRTETKRKDEFPGRLGISEYSLRRRADRLAKVISQYPDLVARGLASRDEAAWEFGRLYLVGAITREQKDAADELDRVTKRYRRMLKRYGHLQAANLEQIGGRAASENLSPQALNSFERAQKKYDEVYGRFNGCSEKSKEEVLKTLEEDTFTDLAALREGLDALTYVRRGSIDKEDR